MNAPIITPAAVRKSVTVNAPADRAFRVFTEGFSTWWPASHSIGTSPLKQATIEPRAGGRWFETGEDGSQCDWGEVLVWEPPHRLVLIWRIGLDWKFDPDLHTEVELRFTALPGGKTEVVLEHRKLENYGDKAESAQEMFSGDGAWVALLEAFAEKAAE